MLRRLLALTFVQSFATILLERGLYFYTEDVLHFSRTANLSLALLFGLLYATGAVLSHRITRRRGERPTLSAAVAGLALLNLTLALRPSPVALWLGFAGIAFLEGLKWPVIESYVTAGTTPARAMAVLGRFNIAWSSAIPLGLFVAGPLIASASPTSLFWLAAALHTVSLLPIRTLPPHPAHLDAQHPERPPAAGLARYRALMASARWSLLGACAMLFLLAPLMPAIFTGRLGFDVRWAAGLSALIDVMRLAAFALLGALPFWRGRTYPLALAAILLPLGFAAVLFGPTLATVVAGQLLFGLATGTVYYAAIYHAMVLHNASVQAGGQHEALIGLGFALGPAVGLAGLWLNRILGNETLGMTLVLAPLITACVVAAVLPLWKLRRTAAASDQTEGG